MNWTAAEPGQLDVERALTLIEQTPGEVIFLSAAETDLYSVASIWRKQLGSRLRVLSAVLRSQTVAADHYSENVIKRAKLVVARLLGGKACFPHFIQGLSDLREEYSWPRLLILSGTDLDEPELAAISDFPEIVRERLFAMFKHGGLENIRQAGASIELLLHDPFAEIPEAKPMPAFAFLKITPEPPPHPP